MSYIGLALVALTLVAAVVGPRLARRARLISLARGTAGAAGVSALAAHGMPHLSLAEGICAVIVVSILSAGVLAPQLRARSLSAAVSAASVLFLGFGAVGLGLHLVTDQGLLAAVVVVAAALAVGLVTRLGAGSASDRLLGGTAVAFIYGLIVLVGWLESSGREQLDAHYALGVMLGMWPSVFRIFAALSGP